MSRNQLPVLLYHHVGDHRPGTYPALTVGPKRFERHVAWLNRQGYRSLTIDDVARWKADKRAPSGRRVLISFDDAYADIAHAALPVLRAAGFSAVIFVATGCIGKTNRWDVDLGGTHSIMTAEQIGFWCARGIEFGAHTRTHADVTRLPEAEARTEMAGSKDDLEAILDRPVTSFAYPYGTYDAVTIQIAASIFELAFAVDGGLNDRTTDPYRIRRTMVSPRDAAFDVELRARLGFSPRERARAWVSGRRQSVRELRG